MRLSLVVGVLITVALLLWPSTVALHEVWVDPAQGSFHHGYLVLLASVYLLYLQREKLETASASPASWSLLPLVLCAVLWLICLRAGLQDLHLILLIAIAWLSLLACFGWKIASIAAFPVLYLGIALPAWASLNGVLQFLTVHAVDLAIHVAGLPANVHGNFIEIPGGLFEVEGGCSGLHYFVVGLAISALQGQLADDSLKQRFVLIALMTALAILANWIRVFTIVVAGYLTNMQHYLVVVDHYKFGWAVFALATITFVFVTNKYAPARRHPRAATEGLPSSVVYQESIARSRLTAHLSTPIGWFPSLAIIASVAVVATLSTRRDAAYEAPPVSPAWPSGVGAWQGPLPVEGGGWRPRHRGATASDKRQYLGHALLGVELYQATYATQRQGAEMIGEGSAVVGEDTGLEVRSRTSVRTPKGRWLEMQVRQVNGDDYIMRVRWIVGERSFASPLPSPTLVWPDLDTSTSQCNRAGCARPMCSRLSPSHRSA